MLIVQTLNSRQILLVVYEQRHRGMNPTLCEMFEEKHRHTQTTINEYNITTANGVNMFGLLAYGNILIITHQAVANRN